MEWNTASADVIDQGLAHFSGMRSAAEYQLCSLIQAVDANQSWMCDGARSLAEWVSLRLRVRFSMARRLVGVARRLEELPFLSECFGRGELSLDQVDAISRMATADTEEALVGEAVGLSNHELDRKARKARKAQLTVEEERAVWERRRLVRQWNLDESELKFWGNLPGVAGELFDTAIQEGIERVPVNPETGTLDPVETRAGDALVELAATTGDHSSPPQITVHADLDALTTNAPGVSELGSGALIPNDTARRLACDAVVETTVHDGENMIIGIGRNSRIVPGWLRRQVSYRDGSRCRFPGCNARHWLQVHHIQHWADGGPTDLDNLILLCGFHHRFSHEHHWIITTTTTGDFQFRKPDHTLYPPPRPDLHPRLAQLIPTGRST